MQHNLEEAKLCTDFVHRLQFRSVIFLPGSLHPIFPDSRCNFLLVIFLSPGLLPSILHFAVTGIFLQGKSDYMISYLSTIFRIKFKLLEPSFSRTSLDLRPYLPSFLAHLPLAPVSLNPFAVTKVMILR